MDLSKIKTWKLWIQEFHLQREQLSHKHPTISDFLRNFEMFSADARDKANYREILD